MLKTSEENKVFNKVADVADSMSEIFKLVSGENFGYSGQAKNLRLTGVSGSYSKRIIQLEKASLFNLIFKIEMMQQDLEELKHLLGDLKE